MGPDSLADVMDILWGSSMERGNNTSLYVKEQGIVVNEDV